MRGGGRVREGGGWGGRGGGGEGRGGGGGGGGRGGERRESDRQREVWLQWFVLLYSNGIKSSLLLSSFTVLSKRKQASA